MTKNVKFFNEFSKVAFAVLLVVGVAASLSYPIATLCKLEMDSGYSIAGLGLLFGDFAAYVYKNYMLKNSLNKNHLKIDEQGDVTPIDE